MLMPDVVMEGYRATSAELLGVTVAPANNISLRGFLLRLRFEQWTELSRQWTMLRMNPAWLAAEVPVLLGIAGLAARLWWVKRPDKRTTLAVGLALILLPLGVCWTHYLAFCAPLLALLLAHKKPWVQKLALVVMAWAVLTHLHPLPSVLHFNVRDESELVSQHPTVWAVRAFLPWLGVWGLAMLGLGLSSPRQESSE